MKAVILAKAGQLDLVEGWPISARQLKEGEELRQDEQAITDEAFDKHVEQLRPTFDAWQAAQSEARTQARFILPAELLLIDRMTNAEFLAFRASNVAAIAKAWSVLHISGRWSPGQRGSPRLRNALETLFGKPRSDELLAKPTRAERTEYELED